MNIPFIVVTLTLWLMIFTNWWLMIRNRRLREQRLQASFEAMGAIAFANALATRGCQISCDDCGNLMNPEDNIDVIQKDDGSIYVGHHSHNRRIDWGRS